MLSKELQYAINLLEDNCENIENILEYNSLYEDDRKRLILELELIRGAVEQIYNLK